MNKLIQTSNLTKVFRTDEVETTSLSAIQLEIEQGSFTAIMGPSGCGKSTLLNILGMLDAPTNGSYLFGGTEVASLNEKNRSIFRKKNIGFIFQSFNLIDELTIYENIELPLIYRNIQASERKKRVQEVMERLQISHRSKHFPQQLSGGQQQRAAVCRAIITNPLLILADEPTGNLDSKNGEEVMKLLVELNKSGTTIVMVTHSNDHARYASGIFYMMDGQIISQHNSYQPISQ